MALAGGLRIASPGPDKESNWLPGPASGPFTLTLMFRAYIPGKDIVDQKRVYARFMEVYSGFFEQTDHEIGRLLDHLKEKNLFDNTIIVYVIGDNGADPGGGPIGETENTFPNQSRSRTKSGLR